MRKNLQFAFIQTIPVLCGYLFLGMAFGLLLQQAGIPVIWAFLISVFVYAGSLQFALVGILAGQGDYLSTILLTLSINFRHIFYGISFIDKFKTMRKLRPYMIFSLSDETYSLLCSVQVPRGYDEKQIFFFISFLNQLYWIAGSAIGAAAGQQIFFNTKGIDFANVALFAVIFTEQWISAENHVPALMGLFFAIIFLVFLGPDKFLLPSLICSAAGLILIRPRMNKKEEAL